MFRGERVRLQNEGLALKLSGYWVLVAMEVAWEWIGPTGHIYFCLGLL